MTVPNQPYYFLFSDKNELFYYDGYQIAQEYQCNFAFNDVCESTHDRISKPGHPCYSCGFDKITLVNNGGNCAESILKYANFLFFSAKITSIYENTYLDIGYAGPEWWSLQKNQLQKGTFYYHFNFTFNYQNQNNEPFRIRTNSDNLYFEIFYWEIGRIFSVGLCAF